MPLFEALSCGPRDDRSSLTFGQDRMSLEPREPPVETIDGLRPPRAGFPYFAHADHFPFEPGAVAVSPVNAWWLADASFLVYGDADFVEDAFGAFAASEPGIPASTGWAAARRTAA